MLKMNWLLLFETVIIGTERSFKYLTGASLKECDGATANLLDFLGKLEGRAHMFIVPHHFFDVQMVLSRRSVSARVEGQFYLLHSSTYLGIICGFFTKETKYKF